MKAKPLPPLVKVRELLDYDPLTGIFTWRTNRGQRYCAGNQAGRIMKNGYRQITVDGQHTLAHRLAWLHFYGTDPVDQIDHINGGRDDNWIANLRQATAFQNMQNCKKSVRNTSGFRGVCYNKNDGIWQAGIGFNGKLINIGRYSTPEEASEAYHAKAKELFGEFYRGEGA